MNVSEQLLEHDERRTRNWLNTLLTLRKRIEMKRHLKKILDRKFVEA